MSILTKESDLLKFINDKKFSKLKTSLSDIYLFYTKTILAAFDNSISKLLNINFVNDCVSTINIIFWYMLDYSKNMKLTMFLCDRAILLYTEYITMLNISLIDNSDKINLTEVKLFVYKKTIGPLKIIDNLCKKTINADFYNFCISSLNLYRRLINILYYENNYSYANDIKTKFKTSREAIKVLGFNCVNNKLYIKNDKLIIYSHLIKIPKINNHIVYINYITILYYLIFINEIDKIDDQGIIEQIKKKYNKEVLLLDNIDGKKFML